MDYLNLNLTGRFDAPARFFKKSRTANQYYYVYYDLNIWTDFNEQLNKVVELFIPVNNFVWGNDYQFVTNIEDFSFSTVNISKQERIVKASTRLRVLATLMPAFVERKSSIQKAFSIKKVNMSERLF
jgi:hypothetical protein